MILPLHIYTYLQGEELEEGGQDILITVSSDSHFCLSYGKASEKPFHLNKTMEIFKSCKEN